MESAKATNLRWRLTALVYVSCALFLIFQGGKASFMLFCILNVLLIYLVLGKWSGISGVKGMRTTTQGSGKENALTAGSRLEVQLHVKIPGVWPIPYVLVRERLLRQGKQSVPFEVSFVPDFKRSGSVFYSTPPLQRGYYRFEETECSTRDIFGLFEHTGRFDSPEPFYVLPQIVSIRHWNQLQRGMKGPFSHAASSRSAKETTQLNGVREYHYGDRLSRIHWNATAKTGEWKSKEFERESIPRTVVVLDRGSFTYAKPERFELAVSVAASLFDFGLRRESSMGLISAGARTEGYEPRPTAEQRKLVMNHLVGVEADGEAGIYRSLMQASSLLAPGSFVVLVTPQEGEEMVKTMQWLDRRGMIPCLIHVDQEGGKPLIPSGSKEWKKLIRAKGWPIYSVRNLQDLPAALEGGGLR
jgi:uncharacterized protein (DUF58 family)